MTSRFTTGVVARGMSWMPLAVVLLLLSAAPAAAEMDGFITRRGDQLMVADQPFRFISFNVPNLLVIEDAFSFTEPNPWRWPDEYEIEDALESVRQMGGRVVRTYVVSVYRVGSDMNELVHVRRPGEFNEDGFRALDKVLEVARRKGIRVIIPLVDQWKWMGGVGDYAAFRGKPSRDFWTDPQLIDDFKQTVRYVIGRRNHYTGTLYRDDPAVFGWETGNELDAPPEWTRQIAAYIKQLDANHLVIDGRSLHGIPVQSLTDPNVDVVTTHHYPGRAADFVSPIREARALSKGKKPYFVGEFGFVDAATVQRTLQAVVDDGVSGALLWSLRFHRREGGFYWHSEGLGNNLYKAYHWPGFDSGQPYEERVVLELLRRQAFAIQGRSPPPLSRPAPPELLPIEHAGHISWRGSAGAASYDVLRATRRDGPWTTIGEGVSDAAVQYRSLFNDQTAIPGERYYYRVVALNVAGASEPSQAIGPVAVASRMLVDEGRDLSLTDQVSGDVAVVTGGARQVQEDIHRLAMPAGSSVVYHVSQAIQHCRVFVFAREPNAAIELSLSSNGTHFAPANAERQAFPPGPADYGYLTPILFQCGATDARATYVKLSVPQDAGTESRRKDSSSGSSAARWPLEISRVEIQYADTP